MRRARSTALRRAFLTLLSSLALFVACDAPPDAEVTPRPARDSRAADLTRTGPAALVDAQWETPRSHWSTRLEVFPGPSSARFLREGWSLPGERTSDGRPFVWGQTRRSELRIPLDAPRALVLRLRGFPLSRPEAPTQQVAVVLNGHAVGRWTPSDGVGRISLPARALRAGPNRIELRYRWAVPPSEFRSDSKDSRPLAVAFEEIALVDHGEQPDRVSVRLGGEGRERPGLRQVRDGSLWLWRVPPEGAALELGVLRPSGSGPARGRVLVEHDEGRRVVWSEEMGRGYRRLRLDLAEHAGRAVRLELSVAGLDDGAWIWTEPRIVAPREAASASPASPEEGRPHIVVVVLDALSRSRVGAYGGAHDLTPAIDALAAEGLLVEDAHAQAAYTLASTASLFTSQVAAEHGVADPEDRLLGSKTTLAEVLHDAGFATAAFSANGFASSQFGLGQGFEHFVDLWKEKSGPVLAPDFEEAVAPWLDRAERGRRPVFLYLHVLQPHEPFDAAPARFYPDVEPAYRGPMLFHYTKAEEAPDPERLERLDKLYRGNVRYADHVVGRIVAMLRERAVLDETLLVVTSDHGEALGERGLYGHNVSVDEVMTAIPLVLRLPGDAPRTGRISAPAASIDIPSTILRHVGIEPPTSFRGGDLLAEDFGSRARLVFSRTVGDSPGIGIWLDRFKYVYRPGERPSRLLLSDWSSFEDRADAFPVTLDLLEDARSALARRRDLRTAPEEGELSRELKESLRALGYTVE